MTTETSAARAHGQIAEMNDEECREALHRLVTTALDLRTTADSGISFVGRQMPEAERRENRCIANVILNTIRLVNIY